MLGSFRAESSCSHQAILHPSFIQPPTDPHIHSLLRVYLSLYQLLRTKTFWHKVQESLEGKLDTWKQFQEFNSILTKYKVLCKYRSMKSGIYWDIIANTVSSLCTLTHLYLGRSRKASLRNWHLNWIKGEESSNRGLGKEICIPGTTCPKPERVWMESGKYFVLSEGSGNRWS
jgi:hypothetical protein